MCNVFIMDFPNTKVNEMVTRNEDGSYSIFINAKLSHAGALKAYRHAMNHINNGDFDKSSEELIKFEKEAERETECI